MWIVDEEKKEKRKKGRRMRETREEEEGEKKKKKKKKKQKNISPKQASYEHRDERRITKTFASHTVPPSCQAIFSILLSFNLMDIRE